MNRDSRAKLGGHLRRSVGHLVSFGLLSFGVASWLTGCLSATDGSTAGCASAADCASGAQCVNAACVSGAAGSSGMTGFAGAGLGVGGSALGGASGLGSSGAPSYAGAPGAPGASGASGASGAPGSAGQSSGGSSGHGSGGSAGQASGGSAGKAGSSGVAGSAGSAGTGGMSGGDVTGKCKDDFLPAANNGSVTRYDFSQGTSLPACAYVITHKGAGKDGDWDTVEGISTGDGGYFGAMNTADYNNGATCSACAEITYNGGTKLVITIVDECPIGSNSLCVKGHIDLSRKAIRQLQPNSSLEHLGNGGNGSISWRYVTCPATGNVKMRLHPKTTADWQPVVIENGLYPLNNVTINGTAATRAGNATGGNAWLANGAKLPFTVRATDLSGDTIQATFNGGSDLTDVGKQFMCTK
jgi:expansin